MKTTRKISSEQQFNASQPCGSDAHNGCDKCEPSYDFVEVPAQLVRDLITQIDVVINTHVTHNACIHDMADKLEALLKEQSK